MRENLAIRFSSGIDFKQVKNHLQGLRGNLYPWGIGGEGYVSSVQAGHMPDRTER